MSSSSSLNVGHYPKLHSGGLMLLKPQNPFVLDKQQDTDQKFNRRLIYQNAQYHHFKVFSTFYRHPLYLLTPEYQAAASVILTTTSTGTRSATAPLVALIVRRIPFPALKEKKRQDPPVNHMKFCCFQKEERFFSITYSNEKATRSIEVINPSLSQVGRRGFSQCSEVNSLKRKLDNTGEQYQFPCL